ncbi:hypothetical protein B0H14DRAFT_2654048 [Mycena olivaceomarginata]|nr:hypothetical protein B0H14DRAFT_2654048 [Mycena olivaceomarginata]
MAVVAMRKHADGKVSAPRRLLRTSSFSTASTALHRTILFSTVPQGLRSGQGAAAKAKKTTQSPKWGSTPESAGGVGDGRRQRLDDEQRACGRIPKRRLRWRVSVGPGNVTDPGSVRAPNARFASGPRECEHREIRTKAPTPNSTAVVPNICIGKGEDRKGESREAGKYGQCKTCAPQEKNSPTQKKYCGPPSTICPDPPAMAGPSVAASSRSLNLALEASLLSEEREEERRHQQRLRNQALMDAHR